MHEMVEILLTPDHVFVSLQKRQNQLIKENPFELKESVEEVNHMITWYHTCKQAENPLTGIHLRPYVIV